MEGSYDRKRRVRRLKKIIVGSALAAMIIPLTVSIALGIYAFQLKGRIKELEAELAQVQNIESAETGIYTTAVVETSLKDQPETLKTEEVL